MPSYYDEPQLRKNTRNLIQTSAKHRKISHTTPRTPEQAKIAANDKTARSNKTWTKLADIFTQLQQREFSPHAQNTKETAPEIYHGEEDTSKQLMRGKYLMKKKLNRRVYILQKWIRRNQMRPMFQAWGEISSEYKHTN